MTILALTLPLVLLALPLAAPISSAAEAKPAASASQWLKIPDKFVAARFVQSHQATHASWRVAVVVPPGGGTPRIMQGSGRSEVDAIAFDYARATARDNRQLREMNRTKELAFNLLVAPPALDSHSLRNTDGDKPVPAGEEDYFPFPQNLRVSGGMAMQMRRAEGIISLRFPAGGGRPIEAWMTRPYGDDALDFLFLRYAIANWQTKRTSSQPFVIRHSLTLSKTNFGGRLTTEQ